MARVITSLKRFQLRIENLNKLVLTMKIWPNDPKFKCTSGPKSFEGFFNFKDNVVSENEDLIMDFNFFEKD